MNNNTGLSARETARRQIWLAGITTDNVTNEQLKSLYSCLCAALEKSDCYRGTYRMNRPKDLKFMTCKTDQWKNREAVSFNRDGFIGFAGWADNTNIAPILDGVTDWLISMGHDIERT